MRAVPRPMIEAGTRVLQQWLSECEHERTLRELVEEIYATMERTREGENHRARPVLASVDGRSDAAGRVAVNSN